MAEIFGFPDPVNETSARVVAGGVASMAIATVALDQPWVLAPLTYGFLARVLTGPKLSPLGRLATEVVTPRIHREHKFVPGPPKRLAQGVGLVLTSTASMLAATGRRRAAYGVLGVLIVAACLEAVFGYCIACRMFPLLMRTGLVPEETCARCNDLWGTGGGKAATDSRVAVASNGSAAGTERAASTP